MPSPYIPNGDGPSLDWMDNFANLLLANPALYGLGAVDATAVDAVRDTFATSLALATNPATRTSVTITAKDAAKAAALALCRLYAQQIRRNEGVANLDKAALGLTIVDPTPTPVPPPTTSPLLDVTGATPLQLTLRFHDQNTPTSRAKPDGVAFLEVHAVASAVIVTDQTSIPFKIMATRQPVALSFDPGDVGKQAYIAARYVNRKGAVGPWSAIVAFTVANG